MTPSIKGSIPIIMGLLVLGLTLACQSNPEEPIPFSQPPGLLWKTPLFDNLALASSMDPMVDDGMVVFSRVRSLELQSTLIGLDAATGESKWTFDQLHPESRPVDPQDIQYTYQGILAYATRGPIYGIEMRTGKLIWEDHRYDNGHDDNVGYGDMVWTVFRESFPDRQRDVHLAYANMLEGKWENAYTLSGDSVWRPGIDTYAVQVTSEGDTICYLKGSRYHTQDFISIPYLICYNFTQDSVLFEHTGLSYGYLAVHQGRLLAGGSYMRCYDALDGTLLWEQGVPDGIPVGMTVSGDQVVVSDGSDFDQRLHLFDIATGKKVWTSDRVDSESRLLVHKGVVYGVGRKKLYAINLADGKLLWTMQSPHDGSISGAFFMDGLNIDPLTDRIYLADYVYAMCFQLE